MKRGQGGGGEDDDYSAPLTLQDAEKAFRKLFEEKFGIKDLKNQKLAIFDDKYEMRTRSWYGDCAGLIILHFNSQGKIKQKHSPYVFYETIEHEVNWDMSFRCLSTVIDVVAQKEKKEESKLVGFYQEHVKQEDSQAKGWLSSYAKQEMNLNYCFAARPRGYNGDAVPRDVKNMRMDEVLELFSYGIQKHSFSVHHPMSRDDAHDSHGQMRVTFFNAMDEWPISYFRKMPNPKVMHGRKRYNTFDFEIRQREKEIHEKFGHVGKTFITKVE